MRPYAPLVVLFLALIPKVCFGGTSAEQKVAAANQALAGSPNSLQAYNDLAAALCDRARESDDSSYFTAARSALQHSFQLAPGDYSAQKLQVGVLLGLHESVAAWQLATNLNHRVPDDVAVWGLLAESDLALGNYPQAQKAAQWMFNLRPGNVAAFHIAAQVREVYGDLEGANDFLHDALRNLPDNEVEQRAILLTESARLVWLTGNSKRASAILDEARQLFPSYNRILQVAAKIEQSNARFAQAADLLGQRYKQIKSTAALYDYAEMLQLARRKSEAIAAFRTFETKALSESTQASNANRELIFYYTDHTPQPLKALSIASSEATFYHDNLTRDALAWALFRNGKIKEAKAEMQRALETGTRDPDILYHAKCMGAKQ